MQKTDVKGKTVWQQVGSDKLDWLLLSGIKICSEKPGSLSGIGQPVENPAAEQHTRPVVFSSGYGGDQLPSFPKVTGRDYSRRARPRHDRWLLESV